jgi:glucose/arabinose dehydrogenase
MVASAKARIVAAVAALRVRVAGVGRFLRITPAAHQGILIHVRRLLILVWCVAAAACDSRSSPAPPVVTPPGNNETITGLERIAWDQRAGDAAELAAIGYVLYVDGNRTSLTEVTCATTSAAAGFACSGRLPPLTPGAHTLQLASTITDGTLLESERSAALSVTVVRQIAGDERPPEVAERTTPPLTPGPIVTSDGTRLRLELVAGGFERPTDLAFTPDARLIVAERGGTVRIVPREARRTGEPATTPLEPVLSLADAAAGTMLHALAIDPQFERTRFVFTLSSAAARSGEPVFTVARFRESGGTLGDRIVLLDGVRAGSPRPAGSLRFGPDGMLYAAFDDGGDARRRNDRASLNGKVVRLNADGTTPADQAGASPVYAEGYGAPAGFDWDTRQDPPTLWVADRDDAGGTLRAVIADAATRAGEKRGVTRGAQALPRASVPASIAFYRDTLIPAFTGSLLVASNEGRHLLRVAGQRVETLLQDQAGGVGAVAVAPGGAIYIANASSVARIVPDER